MRDILKQKLVWIAAFGYFVDLFDLVLYGVVRVNSLKSIGLSDAQVFTVGGQLLNFQMGGMLIGGFLWGILGDKRGRKEALFGSILIYSLATFLNAYAYDYNSYAFLRFMAGFGLAGELGAAITLVSECVPQKSRGLGSVFVASIGFLGAALSSYVCQVVTWQHAYQLGGALGFVLLAARLGVRESALYLESKDKNHSSSWGSLKLLFLSSGRMKLFALCLFAGVPIWYVAGILSYFAPEFAKELQIQGTVTAGTTILMGYLGAIIGDVACGVTSQVIKSRKKAIMMFMIVGASTALLHPYFIRGASSDAFYFTRFLIGLGNGCFAVLVAWIAELFGTNLRTTATTALTNLIRASVIPLTFSFQYLSPRMGLIPCQWVLGGICFGLAYVCIYFIPETFHRDLKFVEE